MQEGVRNNLFELYLPPKNVPSKRVCLPMSQTCNCRLRIMFSLNAVRDAEEEK
jgi:hypothetical protein